MAGKIIFQLQDLRKFYGQREVLKGINLSFLEGAKIGVIGANGSGKSTFARLLNGLVIPDRGVVTVDGVTTADDAAAVRRKVGFVFTDPDAQIVMPTVAEDVAFGLRRRRYDRVRTAQIVAQALGRVGLAEHADRPAHLLSGGQKQLLAVTAVLITEPRVLVCDEPTTLLDRRNTRLVLDLLDGLPQQVIMVTHDLDSVLGYDRALVFDEGRLVADDEPGRAVGRYRALVG